MSDARSGRGPEPEQVPTSDVQALSKRLLPPLADRAGPAHRRSQMTSDVMVRAVVEAALAAQDPAIRQAGLAEEAGSGRLGSRSRSGRRPLMLAAAMLALPSAGALATVMARVVFETKPAPAKAIVAKGPSQGEVDLASAPLEDLLALANQLRRSRDWRAADEVYRTVTDRFPGSDAAVVAEIVSATLHVEQLDDARGALEGYRRALVARPTGPLAEDARWGVVEALRTLGDRHGELNALREFLERHPVSSLAPVARRRVAELAE